MKTNFLMNRALGPVAIALGLAGGLALQTAKAQDLPPPSALPDTDSMAALDVPTSPALPSNIYPTSPLAQVIKLMQAGVSDDVIKNYVNNSTSTFNLDSDKIIYLRDIGLPDDVVTAMMQRDQVLQQQMAAAAYQPPAPAPEPVVAAEAAPAPPTEEVTVNYFYDSLAPYGTWINVEGYGRCWRPSVVALNAGWSPYCDGGHWIYTDDGWYWYSTYSWGWAPFHYGRWFHHARFGWCWVPDTVWGPSWVTWRYSDAYCGWAPLPPGAVYREGAGFFYNGASVSVGFDFGIGASLFTFVSTRDFCDPHPRRYRVAPREVTQIYNHTTIINNFDVDRNHHHFINHGIDPGRITAVTHSDIRPIPIRDATTPIGRGEQLGRDGRTLIVNRPHFSTSPSAGVRGNPAPPANRDVRTRTEPPAQPETRPTIGSPYRPGNDTVSRNNNPEPRRNNFQPAPPAQPPPPRGTMIPPAPRREKMAPPAPRTQPVPVAPRELAPPSPYNGVSPSTDNRRYPSPRLKQMEPQSPRVNPPGPVERPSAPAASAPPAVRQSPAPAAPPSRPQDSGRGRKPNGR